MKSIKAWGVGQLATGPLLTLTIIVINSDTQSSLFTGSGERERERERRDKLVYWRGPFSQGAVVHHLGWGGWWDAVAGCAGGWGAPQLKTHCDLVAGRTHRGGKFKQGEETWGRRSSRYPALQQPPSKCQSWLLLQLLMLTLSQLQV